MSVVKVTIPSFQRRLYKVNKNQLDNNNNNGQPIVDEDKVEIDLCLETCMSSGNVYFVWKSTKEVIALLQSTGPVTENFNHYDVSTRDGKYTINVSIFNY